MIYKELHDEIMQKTWNSGKEKMNILETRNDMMNNSVKKKLDHLDETIITIMLCVSFTNLK